ncbi:hypothetical protein MRX96_039815 [Rhipicephalus microplus]
MILKRPAPSDARFIAHRGGRLLLSAAGKMERRPVLAGARVHAINLDYSSVSLRQVGEKKERLHRLLQSKIDPLQMSQLWRTKEASREPGRTLLLAWGVLEFSRTGATFMNSWRTLLPGSADTRRGVESQLNVNHVFVC